MYQILCSPLWMRLLSQRSQFETKTISLSAFNISKGGRTKVGHKPKVMQGLYATAVPLAVKRNWAQRARNFQMSEWILSPNVSPSVPPWWQLCFLRWPWAFPIMGNLQFTMPVLFYVSLFLPMSKIYFKSGIKFAEGLENYDKYCAKWRRAKKISVIILTSI